MNSLSAYLKKNNCKVTTFAPKRENTKSEAGVYRYNSLKELFGKVRKGNYDVVFGTSPPMLHSFVALIASKISSKKFIMDLRDPWVYSIRSIGVYKNQRIKLFIYSLIEKFSYLLSNNITVATKRTGEIVSKSAWNKPSIVLAPNGADPKIFSFSKTLRNKTRRELGLKNSDIVAVYSGSFSDWEVDKLLKAMSHSLNSVPKFKLIMRISSSGGFSEDKNKLLDTINKLGISKSTKIIDYGSTNTSNHSETIKYFSAADFGVSSLTQGLDYSIPVKNYVYLSCNLPIIAKGPKGPLSTMFKESNIGVISSGWGSFEKSIKSVVKNFSSFKKKYSNVRTITEKKYSREKTNKIIFELMKSYKDL